MIIAIQVDYSAIIHTQREEVGKLTLLNIAKGYSLPWSQVRRQWWSTAPSFLAGLVNGIHFHGRTLFIPSLAFTLLYP